MKKLARPVKVWNIDRPNNVGRAATHKVEVNIYFKKHIGQVQISVCNLERQASKRRKEKKGYSKRQKRYKIGAEEKERRKREEKETRRRRAKSRGYGTKTVL